ncbi:hypothetical protein LIER_40544 [Lithospermum erythrorhizon]|uniref:Reverse transcriptase domain-containing protein n=1 Tax=Lithospermum erythrorhizon TaxID=34254 RepID=A0AAV3QW36_LITER
MPRFANSTGLTLIPKVENPQSMKEFRPITCCNTLYKIISTILVARVKRILEGIICMQQTAYVPGRRITDGILIMQELMDDYHKAYGMPRCAIKRDIMEA